MNEFAIIQEFFNRGTESDSIVKGIGDDCAVLSPPKGQSIVTSIDTQVLGRHFPEGADADAIAARALRCAASDLAAMGAEPLWFTLALTLPKADRPWLQAFSDGLYQTASQLGIQLIGGDTTAGPLTISIQVLGSALEKSVLLRSGASVGDHIFVSGTLGDGRAGLEAVLGELDCDEQNAAYFQKRYFYPDVRIRMGLLLRYFASSCIDVSDGMLADLNHICEASGVGASIDASKIPMSQELLASVPTSTALEWALTGGDDYQLCFTATEKYAEQLQAQARTRAIDVTWIGTIVEGSGIRDAKTGRSYKYSQAGFSHF